MSQRDEKYARPNAAPLARHPSQRCAAPHLVATLAEILNVPKTWVYAAARRGEIPSVVLGRYVRFDEADIARWVAAQKPNGGR